MFLVMFQGKRRHNLGVFQYELAARRRAARVKAHLAYFGLDTDLCRVLVK